jgi:chromate transporter
MPRQQRADAPSLLLLFWQCLVIGVTSFGGGLNAYVRLVFVHRRHWVTEDEFLECLEVAQTLPGPNVVNLVVMLTRLLRGVRGATLGFTALVLPAIAANIALVAFILGHAEGSAFNAILAGFGAAAAGLSVANAGQMGRVHLRWAVDIALTIAAIGFILWLKPSLLVAILLFGSVGILLHYRRARRADERQSAQGSS